MGRKNMESEASLFACLLLMPLQFIAEDLKDGINLADDKKVNELAKKYDVPLTALLFRIGYYFKHKK